MFLKAVPKCLPFFLQRNTNPHLPYALQKRY